MLDHHDSATRARRGKRLSARARMKAATLVSLAVASVSVTGSAAAATSIQVLPSNAPPYIRSTYPSALTAPLPIFSVLGQPLVLMPSQSYSDPKGLLGIYQSSGIVFPATNAFFQPLGSNGRTCFTCHQPASGMSLSTTAIQQIFNATGGRDPLFAPVDGSNCPSSVPREQTIISILGGLLGGGTQSAAQSRSLLLNKGLIRIFLPVPANAEYKIEVVSDPYGCNTNPAYAQQKDAVTQESHQMISVYRRPRMSANLKFITTPFLTLGGGGLPNIDFVTGAPVTDPATGAQISGNIMWDGREPTLESQARNATLGHAQALRAPTDAQVAQIVAYEKSVFAAQTYHNTAGSLTAGLGSTANGGPAPMATLPVSFGGFKLYDSWPATQQSGRGSIARGQALFNTRALTVDNVAGFNNAVLLGVTNPTSTTCASCHGNMQAGNDPFPAGQRDIGVGGQAAALGGPAPSSDLPVFRVTCNAGLATPYYGSVVLTNDPGLALISGKCADIGRRSVPQLRAMAARAPYFSDGSAASLSDVVRFYDKRFKIRFTDAEVNDLTHFLESL